MSKSKIYRRAIRRRLIPRLLRHSVWAGMILFWLVVLNLFVDLPNEYKLRHSTDKMRSELEKLSTRYDSVSMVISNVVERDENVFRKLFESNPYNIDIEHFNRRYELHRELLGMDNEKLCDILSQRCRNIDAKAVKLRESNNSLNHAFSAEYLSTQNIPSIQPVNNRRLTLLAAGKKPLINPFHRTMTEHHGVDYLIPEGTAVFATADGVVKNISEKNSTHGKSLVIDHGNGYETSYSHLLDIRVKNGQSVKRGDIVALSGNTGLSFAPHLHYEVIMNGMRVDPVHYFFMELTPEEYQKIINIALSSMQSFD